jgi:hypothetical protein
LENPDLEQEVTEKLPGKAEGGMKNAETKNQFEMDFKPMQSRLVGGIRQVAKVRK